MYRGLHRSLKVSAAFKCADRCLSSAATDAVVQPSVADVKPEVIDPLKCHDFFGVRNLVNVEDLFNARVHLGHKIGVRHPHMLPYLFGNRLDVDIIDLEQTAVLLGDALNFLAHIAFRSGIVLFVSRHRQTISLVEQAALDCGEYAHCLNWRPGIFTNTTVRFGAVTRLPDVVVFVSTLNNVFEMHEGVTETAKMNIPSIGVVDSSCDPRLISFPIPGNDDTPCAIELYCLLFKEAVLRGKAKAREHSDLADTSSVSSVKESSK